MKNLKKFLSVLLVTAMVLSMAACGGQQDGAGTTAPVSGDENAQTGSYNVIVKTAGGMVLPGIDVYVYADDSLSDLKQYGETDENGEVSFQMNISSNYAVVLSGVPKGYQVESSYGFSGNTAVITLTSSLIQDESLAGATLGLGDVMYDFSVATPDGTIVTLSEMLAEKEMVLINFWYTTCTWCVAEFPFMEEAYKLYSDKIGIIALNPFEEGAAITSFQEQQGLTFPMASCPSSWSATFGISGYPTSIIVDRYGVICVVEAGGITSLRPFVSTFEHFSAEDYTQQIFHEGIGALVTDVKPTFEMDTPENVAALLNNGQIEVTYHAELDEEDAEFAWPFIAAEKNGEACMKASNQQIEGSFAIIYADVTLKAGQAFGFDFLRSTETAADVMYVIVDGQDINAISGYLEKEKWETVYPLVALEDGTYEVALCYIKDESTNVGDDTVYIKNAHIVDAADIAVETYIPRTAATTKDGFEYSYVDVVLNEKDGYYHVGTKNGPLLLANLMNYSLFNEEMTIFDMAYEGAAKEYYEDILPYFTHASNSNLNGYCTVNAELAELLKKVANIAGFDGTEDEWLKICEYYETYGPGGTQLEDPIKGLSPASAYKAKLGKNVSTNYFYYNRIIMPRGLLAEFIPTQSGVYRITSRNDSQDGVEGWIFDENREKNYTFELAERQYNDSNYKNASNNVSMVFYMEAGEKYYISIAFWDMYEVGHIYYDIEFVAPTYDLFRLAAPGYFTYDSNATGDAMYYLINGGIDVVLGKDGIYYEDLGKDANGKQRYGSKLYADFTGITSLFNTPIATVNAYDENGKVKRDADGNPVQIQGMIDKGGFDFSKTEYDQYILTILQQQGNDVEAADKYLKELWGADYESYAETYMIEDVFEGRYHGDGEDMTEEMRGYASKIITTGAKEQQGCVVVDERLGEILQMLMDKYTFANVDHSWIKLCYYYQHLDSENWDPKSLNPTT